MYNTLNEVRMKKVSRIGAELWKELENLAHCGGIAAERQSGFE